MSRSAERADLLSNQDVVVAAAPDVSYQGGKTLFMAEGTFDGATVTLQIKTPQGAYITLDTATANKVANLDLPPGLYRANLTGGTDPEDIFVYLISVPQG